MQEDDLMKVCVRNLAIAAVVAVLGWMGISSIMASPSYALYELKRAVVARNGTKAAEYIDFKKVTESLIDEEEKARVSMGGENVQPVDPRAQLFAQILTRGLLRSMADPIASMLQTAFIKKVEDPNTDVSGASLVWLYAAAALRRHGSHATTYITDDKGQRVNIGMTLEDGRWKITSLSGPAVRNFFRMQLTQMGQGLIR